MRSIRYSKYVEEDLGIGAEELLQALADFLLESGFNTQYSPYGDWNERTLDDLKQAITTAAQGRGKTFLVTPDGALSMFTKRLDLEDLLRQREV